MYIVINNFFGIWYRKPPKICDFCQLPSLDTAVVRFIKLTFGGSFVFGFHDKCNGFK